VSSNVTVGSIVYGSAGIGRKVLGINGDTLTIETSDGKGLIPFSRVVRVELPPLIDRLEVISLLDKPDAIEQLTELLAEFTDDEIYQASLKLDNTFQGIFIREELDAIA
jgi:hypothetical protein